MIEALTERSAENRQRGIQDMKFLRDITEFIFLEDLPKKADIIIVPGNTWPQPARRAAALYQAGMAPYIVVSGRYSFCWTAR